MDPDGDARHQQRRRQEEEDPASAVSLRPLHGVGVGRARDAPPEAAPVREEGAGRGADQGHGARPPVVPRRLRGGAPRGAGLRVALPRRRRPPGQPRLRAGAPPLGPRHRLRRHQDGGGEGVRGAAGAGEAGGGDGRGERPVAEGAGEGRVPEGRRAAQLHRPPRRRSRRRRGRGRGGVQLLVVRPSSSASARVIARARCFAPRFV